MQVEANLFLLWFVQLYGQCFGFECFEPPVNYIYHNSLEDFYCPAYRNLIRHVPMEDGLCPYSGHPYRKQTNCLSDRDCPKESYCCFSICHGITRCYNPYSNQWADTLPSPASIGPCPLIQIPRNETREAVEKVTTTSTATPTTQKSSTTRETEKATSTTETTTTTTASPQQQLTTTPSPPKHIAEPESPKPKTQEPLNATPSPPKHIEEPESPKPKTQEPLTTTRSPPKHIAEPESPKPKTQEPLTITPSPPKHIAEPESPKPKTQVSADDVYDQLAHKGAGDDDAKFVAEEGV